MPRVSIVLPTYNQAGYLSDALDSILAQTYRDYELIVVNDGSTDRTSEILAAYSSRTALHLIETENHGLPTALNRGFRDASGSYLTWTSSDNIMLPRMLETLVQAMDDDSEIGLVYADWFLIDEDGETISVARSRKFDRLLLLRDDYINACFMYRRECQARVGEYSPVLRGSEDWDYWLRIAKHYRMRHVPRVLYKFRVHSQSMSANRERLVTYREFAAKWRRDDPLVWYASKVKWHLLRLLLGRSPSVQFQPSK